MAEYNTIRVGELPPAPWGMTNLLPKEVAGNLTRGTVQQLADLISDYIGTASSLAFNPTTILDGGTLPDTDSPEWVLVGKGTFYNVNGGATITTTEELNALTSNGTVWDLSVEIPINVELAGIVQSVRSGYTTTAPSEDAVFNAIAQSIPEGTEMLVNKQNSLVPDPSGVKYITANAVVNGLDEKQNTLRLYTVGGNQTVSNDWNKNTIVFTTSGTITVPDNLSVSFYFNGITLPGVNLTWVLTGDTTWVSGDPGITTENKRFIFAKKSAEESIIFIDDITSTNELAEGSTNLYFTTARVLSTVLTGLSMLTGTAIEPTDTVLVALGKLQKQISDISTSKQDIANQIEVPLPATVLDSWHGKTVIFTSTGILTIPATLLNSFVFNGITLTGVTLSWAITTPKTWLFITPLPIAEKQIFTLTQRGSTNSVMLLPVQ